MKTNKLFWFLHVLCCQLLSGQQTTRLVANWEFLKQDLGGVWETVRAAGMGVVGACHCGIRCICPRDGKLVVPDLKNEIISSKLLANGTAINTEMTIGGLIITVPSTAPDTYARVIKVEVKGFYENCISF